MLELNAVQDRLLLHPEKLLRLLRNTPFCRGMPVDNILQDTKVAKVFKKAVASEMVRENSFEQDLRPTLERIWRNGWLHAERIRKVTYYTFPSCMHRW